MIVPLTPLEFKFRAQSLFGTKVGVIDGDKRFTYAEFAQRTNRLANALLKDGLKPRDRVACLAYNSVPLLEAYYGVIEAGGILLPINIRLSPGEIEFILEDSGADFLLADIDFLPLIRSLNATLTARLQIVWLRPTPDGRPEPTYEDWLANASPDAPPSVDIDENATAELFYTSGTTGKPKGVMLTHRNLYLHSLQQLATIPTDDRTVQLHTIPLFHVNGWGTPQTITAVGGTHVMMQKFDPGESLRLIEQEGVTRFLAVPTMLNMILNHPKVGTTNLSTLEFIMTGGSATPPEMVRQGEQILGCPIIAGYGLSETSPVITFSSAKHSKPESEGERITRQASTGLPVIGVDLRVVDDNGHPVARDGIAVGEIAVRSNVVMKGYWNDAEATDAVMGDGWLHTGDLATVNDEGYVLIVDRAKDIIISGGENISSVEIEKVLFEHPAILEAAVIAVPDEQWGESVKAIVCFRPGLQATETEIIEFCRSRLGAFKVPKSVEFRDALPKGGTGKILKRELRQPYWEGLSKRVH